ncbi:MAG: deoxyguanosinetriphosphate triphosphohydrolase [Clostridia bacterium]|nr:deoxyguanosinetriphosphate triphosphohydrolase [Clostridia bacterium]
MMENIRIISEQIEKDNLSPFAALSCETIGRAEYEEKCSIRTEFQRDRDRIIHSKAFRRLKHKTQVFLAPESDHYRTRLTHTLEVSQIARTVARALRLNEDLTEAIALGHDLGHTPFGHAGERVLNNLCDTGFTHFEHSVRVCEKLEKSGKGLNLTAEVLDGIHHHTKDEWAFTAEGRIVRYCDRIAYINHDADDAIRAGVIKESDIPFEIVKFLGRKKSERINTLVNSLVENSDGIDIKMDEQTEKYYNMFHEFLFSEVYRNPKAKSEESKVSGIIEGLFNYFSADAKRLPQEYKSIYDFEGINRAVTDHIAGMTDHYAVTEYTNIYIPKFWKI